MLIRIIILSLTLLLSGCIDNTPIIQKETPEITHDGKSSIQRNGELAVKKGKLCNATGDPVQLRGMSTHGIQYFDEFFQNEKLFEALGSADGWRADVVRVSLYAREGGYEDDPIYFTSQVDRIVEAVTKHGMYAIIDWHQLHPGDPLMDMDNAKVFFEHMASTHGNKKNVIFEICNEPNSSGAFDDDWNEIPLGYTVTWNNHIKPYAEEIIPIIRNHSNNIIIVGTPEYGSAPQKVIGNELQDSNVMYSMHFYADSHGESVRESLEQAIDANLPLFITEFGTQNYAGEGQNNFRETERWLNLLNEHSISWCNWNASNDWRSGAVFKLFENSSDSVMMARYAGEWWTMPYEDSIHLANAPMTSFNSVSDYSDTSKMKEAGKWIFEKIKYRN